MPLKFRPTVAAVLAVLLLAGCEPGGGQAAPAAPAPGPEAHYAQVNGLNMYYETQGQGQQPLVLLHGSLSTITTSFGKLMPELAKSRRVIAVEQQGYGHTADRDQPLSIEQMADDTVALLDQLGVPKADFFGYSMGSSVALQIAVRHPDRVRKLVLAAVSYHNSGLHPGVLDGIDQLKPEDLAGSVFEAEYLAKHPDPAHWPVFLEKTKDLDLRMPELTAEQVKAIKAPVQLIAADSDIVTPEHTVEFFRLLGGGVMGDVGPMPASQLLVVPGASHIGLVDRTEILLPAIPAFLDAPMP
ncbi:alpha/beta fold hydrolase [Amycolatopsis albispora]|uniref:Alpha/beta hydrolase n=1 Tax=Amycolatopsis albispora TaxID=1804986 RepID=A0A344LIP4_9PSEU|nr:alpha/beta hydrolase [Amycolatopsis albispora]AXB47918.1 alpha/beta hydrolase [Amycolatopsis albispora]